jgi:hypothetical protein
VRQPHLARTKSPLALRQNLPTTLIYNGPFSDWVALYVTYAHSAMVSARLRHVPTRPKDGKVTITGDGTSPISWTSIKDVAGFVGWVLTHQDPSDLKNKIFRVEGSRKSWDDILPFVKEKQTQPFEVVHEASGVALVCHTAYAVGSPLPTPASAGTTLTTLSATSCRNGRWAEASSASRSATRCGRLSLPTPSSRSLDAVLPAGDSRLDESIHRLAPLKSIFGLGLAAYLY